MENQKFMELLQKFYDHGLLKEVYRSPRAIVCNVFNQYYVVFPLDLIEKFSQDYPGYVVNALGLKTIVQDDEYVLQHYSALSEEMKDKSLVVVNEALFHHMLSHKEEYAQRPPKSTMDLAFEAELLEKGPEIIRAQLLEKEAKERSAKKTSLFNIFKRK